MKKTLLIVAMLLLVSPVMAGVTVTAVNEGTVQTPDGNYMATVRIDYSGNVDVRAFALDINIDSDGNSPNFQRIRNFKTGESNAASPGYGIFPSRFRDFIVVTGPNWVDPNYNPTTAWNEPGTTDHTWGMGFPRMIVEMGTLYAGDANKPPQSGTLFRFDVNSWGKTGTYCLTIAADTLRGGVVNTDGNTITASYVVPCINFPLSCVTPTPEVGNPKATAENAWTGQGFTLCGSAVVDCAHLGLIVSQESGCYTLPHCIVYTYGVAPAEPNVRGMPRDAARSALTNLGFVLGSDVNSWGGAGVTTVGYVFDQNPPAGTTGCGSTVNLSTVSYPIKDTATTNSMYANWVTSLKPQCWAYPRQCHGDIDGKKQLTQWVSQNDLNIMRTAISKLETQLSAGMRCADLDHKKQLTQWVSQNDLNILRLYISKLETQIPVCGTPGPSDPNYWYFCLPTGSACPSGVTCAPAPTCPNTP